MSTYAAPPEDIVKRLAMLGWQWFLVVADMREVVRDIAEVCDSRAYASFHSPTFAGDKRVRALTRLDDGSFRALVSVEGACQRSELFLAADTKLTCFVPA
jgi:hypothetical protein